MCKLSVSEAKQMLAEAARLNPGPWVRHSGYVAAELNSHNKRNSKSVRVTGFIFIEVFNRNISRFAACVTGNKSRNKAVNLDYSDCLTH